MENCLDTKISQNELVKKYIPLVKKICNQHYGKSALQYEDLEGYAWYGFTIAMNTYDASKSDMSFQSFLAYGIRNAILNGVNEDSRTIAVSYYKQKQMREKGETLPTAISIDKFYDKNESKKCDYENILSKDNKSNLAFLGIENETSFENPYNILINKIKENFNAEYVDMFCSVYGIDGHKVEKGKDIANRYNVSNCLVTKRIKKIIDFIKNDKELSDVLRDLL
jgi:RNA polymerase sigma factor (sigma-70 family)